MERGTSGMDHEHERIQGSIKRGSLVKVGWAHRISTEAFFEEGFSQETDT